MPARAVGEGRALPQRPPVAMRREADAPGSVSSPWIRGVRGVFIFLGVLPWWLPVARSRLPLGELGAALDQVFVPICHRLPERSFTLDGVQMPLCSRCAGIFAGMAIGALIARPRLSMTVWRPALIAIGVLMVVDVLTQDLDLHPIWHPTRLATGVALGYAMMTSFVTHLAPPGPPPLQNPNPTLDP